MIRGDRAAQRWAVAGGISVVDAATKDPADLRAIGEHVRVVAACSMSANVRIVMRASGNTASMRRCPPLIAPGGNAPYAGSEGTRSGRADRDSSLIVPGVDRDFAVVGRCIMRSETEPWWRQA